MKDYQKKKEKNKSCKNIKTKKNKIKYNYQTHRANAMK